MLWTGTGTAGGTLAPAPHVADIDLDGMPEVIAGSTVYSATGTVEFTLGSTTDWFSAAANFDADPQAELVFVANSLPVLRNHDGTLIWGPGSLPTNGRGGAPTIADFDGDSRPEIGIAGQTLYRVFDGDGTLLWERPIRDNSSHMTAATAFDFDGDGTHDVIFRDETTLWVFRGTDGVVLWSRPMSSCTWIETAVVADVDGDGQAELVVGANNNCGFGPQRGVFVFGDSRGAWPLTRRVWNQFSYSITNVLDDGRIPRIAPNNWQVPPGQPYNNARVNPSLSTPMHRYPDLTASVLVLPCQGPRNVVVRVGNGGAVPAPANVPVEFWHGDPMAGGTLLGTVNTPAVLPPGQFVDLGLAHGGPFTASVFVIVDPLDALAECNEANNRHHDPGCLTAAADSNYGTGWPGTAGVPLFGLDGPPQLGSRRQLLVSNSAGVPTVGALVFGSAAVSLPSGLGGTVLALPAVTTTFFMAVPQSSFPLAVPCTVSACGQTFFMQAVVVDAGASHGVSFSRGLRIVFGR